MFHFNNPKGRVPQEPSQGIRQPQAVTAPGTDELGSNPAAMQRIAEIESQRLALMRKNPDFDMKAEMQNPAFVNYVWGNNLTVEDAYFLVHREELLEQARTEAMEALLARRARIPENGIAKSRPAIAKKNPKDLSDKEIDAIIERVRNGETISF